MPAEVRLKTSDVRACFEVVGECRELGGDAVAWHRRLVDRLCHLVEAQVGIGGNTAGLAPGKQPRSLSTFRRGWATQAAADSWEEYARHVPLTRTPEYSRLVAAPNAGGTFLRDHLWPAGAWRRSATFNEVHRACGIDDYILSIARAPGSDVVNSVWLHRPLGARPFAARDWAVVELVHAQIGAMIGGALASPAEPGVSSLSPRLQQTLSALLDGLSEKEIAARLRLSGSTVHEYIGLLYRHFGVCTRAELMAHFIGRAHPFENDAGTAATPTTDNT